MKNAKNEILHFKTCVKQAIESLNFIIVQDGEGSRDIDPQLLDECTYALQSLIKIKRDITRVENPNEQQR